MNSDLYAKRVQATPPEPLTMEEQRELRDILHRPAMLKAMRYLQGRIEAVNAENALMVLATPDQVAKHNATAGLIRGMISAISEIAMLAETPTDGEKEDVME